MSFIVTLTPENIHSYPQHVHDTAEITCYLEGSGVMKTERGDIPFSKGTLIVIPPDVRHGSVSSAPFKNVSVHTDDIPEVTKDFLVGKDDESGDAARLSELLFRLSFYGDEKRALRESVFVAYRDFVFDLLGKTEEDFLAAFKNKLVQSLGVSSFRLSDAIRESGYAEDYLRVLFKKRYGKTPHDYLTSLKMEYAKNVMETYGAKMKICELAWALGYSDPLYFSKLFKKTYGCPPSSFLKADEK